MSKTTNREDQKQTSGKGCEFKHVTKEVLKTKQRHTAARHSVRGLFDRYIRPHHP